MSHRSNNRRNSPAGRQAGSQADKTKCDSPIEYWIKKTHEAQKHSHKHTNLDMHIHAHTHTYTHNIVQAMHALHKMHTANNTTYLPIYMYIGYAVKRENNRNALTHSRRKFPSIIHNKTPLGCPLTPDACLDPSQMVSFSAVACLYPDLCALCLANTVFDFRLGIFLFFYTSRAKFCVAIGLAMWFTSSNSSIRSNTTSTSYFNRKNNLLHTHIRLLFALLLVLVFFCGAVQFAAAMMGSLRTHFFPHTITLLLALYSVYNLEGKISRMPIWKSV